MKKSINYPPYLFSLFFSIFFGISNQFLLKPGYVSIGTIIFFGSLVFWLLIERVLTLFEHKLARSVIALLGSFTYAITFVGLDVYVLKMLLSFTQLSPLQLFVRFFVTATAATLFIERANWSREREKAQLHNLKLQSENIETKFKLLRKQVNPEFLFYCLATLQTMVKTDDPQTENYILKLADVYRQILKKDKNMVSLQEELTLLRAYLFLMQYGRETALLFEIDALDASLHYQLPVFALQSLGDNCIKHAAFSENDPLYIHVFQKNARSITMTHNFLFNTTTAESDTDTEQLEMRYALEGIENGVLIEKEKSTYSTTLKLF